MAAASVIPAGNVVAVATWRFGSVFGSAPKLTTKTKVLPVKVPETVAPVRPRLFTSAV